MAPNQPTHTVIAHLGEVLSLDWNKYNPNQLATSSADKVIKVWDLRNTSRELVCLNGHRYAVRRVRFSPHRGDVIASASYDMSVKVWNCEREPAHSLIGDYGGHTEFSLGIDWNLYIQGDLATCAWDEHLCIVRFPIN